MLKSLLKIQRVVLPKSTRTYPVQVPVRHFSIFDMFKKKKEDANLPQEQKDEEQELQETIDKIKKEQELQDQFVDKKQYFEKLKKEREEFEAEKEKMKKEFDFEEQRDKREYQVNISQVDYAQIIRQNINIRATESFNHLEELYYFISNLRVRLSEENIKKCLEGFLVLAERVNEKDLEKPQFHEFIDILRTNVMIIASNETLLQLLRFADLYIVTDESFWVIVERKVLQKAPTLTTDELITCVIHFSNQKEGTDEFYDQLEKLIVPQVRELNISQLVALAQSYYQVKKGSGEFFNYLHTGIMEKMSEAGPKDLIRLSLVYSAMNIQNKGSIFAEIEKHISTKADQFNLAEICLIAETFGLDNGSEMFFMLLENQIKDKLPELEYEQISQVLKGFFYTYRGSKELFNSMKSRLEVFFPRMELTELALIAKAYHVTENDDKQFESLLERYVITNLKKLDKLTPENLFEVATSYNMTRTGSRELYKILEFVIREKMGDIAKEPEIARGLYYVYTTSGLCSPELIRKLQFVV